MAKIVCSIFIVLAAVVANNAVNIPSHFRLDGRIVGGKETTIEQHPYQVSVQAYGSHICGGSIINETTVLTAGHCVGYVESIRAGSSIRGQGGQVIKVIKEIRHPKYDAAIIDYDAAILILESPLKLANSVSPVKLPNEDEVLPDGSYCTITGWGALREGGVSPSKLQEVTVPSVNQEACQEAYTNNPITPRMLCAGLMNQGGKDSCQGDSGGPLVSSGKLHGIVSWGYGCARPDYPGVYTRVTAVREWVRSVTGI